MSQIVDDLRQVAIEIKTETQVGGNTAARIGGAFERVADALEGTQQIEDMDAAVAAVQQAAQENEQTIQNIVNSLAVVQTTGQSTSDVMSQKAVTDALDAISENVYKDGLKQLAQVGYYPTTISGGSVVVSAADAPDYVLTKGGGIRLKMLSAGTTASTLKIGNADAKDLWYNGAAVSTQNTWEADEIISVFYDGTRFMASNSQGSGGKFATGEKVKDVRIISGSDEYINGVANIPNANILYGSRRVLASTDFEQGTLNPDNGNTQSSITRIRTIDYIEIHNGDVLQFTLNGQSFIYYTYDTNKAYQQSTSWAATDTSITFNSDCFIKILIKNPNDSTIQPSGLLANITISSNGGGLVDRVNEMENEMLNAVFASSKKIPIDLSLIERTNIGYNSSTGKTSSMISGYYSKFVPVEEGKTYRISPVGSTYRVSLATFITKPTAGNQTADIGTECLDQYRNNNFVGAVGQSCKIKIEESRFLYIRVDTASDSISRVGSVIELYAETTYDEDEALPSVLKKKDGTPILPVTEAGYIKYGDGNIGEAIDDIAETIGSESEEVQFVSTFERGAISGGSDSPDSNCMRTPSSNPIRIEGKGQIHCVFTVPKPKNNSPWSKPYFYKDGVLVDDTHTQFQVNNGTVWDYACDGSFNEIRWRVYVSSVASADIAASNISCSFVRVPYGIIGDINELKEREQSIDGNRYLHLGTLLQSSYNTNGAANDGSENYVCMSDALQVPFKGALLKIKTEGDISVGLRFGAVGDSLGSPIWNSDGFTHTITESEQYYHVVFRKANSTISLSDVEQLIEEGKISITYTVDGDDDILRSRLEAEVRARAFMRMGSLPTFCHTSDQHGNVYGLKDAYRFAKYIGVNALINTGDVCSQVPENGYEYAASLAENHTFPTLVSVGNHDGYHVAGEAEIRTEFIDKFITEEYHISAGKTYYYYDFPDLNMRFIVLNSSQTGYSVFNDSGCIMQDQIDFLVSTLLSVPNGYGVVICLHFPLVRKNLMIANNYGFMNDWAETSWAKTLPFATSLQAIVDAYIGKTTFSISYTNVNDGKMNEGSGTSVSKTGDFSSANGEFICWMTGHTHQDRVAFFANTTHKQLCLNITCTASCERQTAGDNIPRNGDGVCRNAFNIYSIDMASKKVYITRIGSDFSSDGIDRKFAIIEYQD